MRRRSAALVAGTGLVALAGAGVLVLSGDDDGESASHGTTTSVVEFPLELPPGTIGAFDENFGPDPSGFSVTVGDKVVFENTDSVPHTFTADDGLFDSGVVAPGESFEILLDGPRTVSYHCEIHAGMRGEFRIE